MAAARRRAAAQSPASRLVREIGRAPHRYWTVRRRETARLLLRRIGPLFAIFFTVYLISALLFYYIELSSVSSSYSLFDAFYWATSTILVGGGYGQVAPTTLATKVLSMGLFVVQVILLGFLISVVMSVVGEIQQKASLGLMGTDMTGHVVVLGYSPVAEAAVRELISSGRKVAVVTEVQDDVPNIRALGSEPDLFVTYGNPADRAILNRVNVAWAQSVIVTVADDTKGLIASLMVMELSPNARIIVAVVKPELRETLKAAGVTWVASPGSIGGRLCASAAYRPDVATIVEDLTTAAVGIDIQEYVLTQRTPISRQSFGEARQLIEQTSGCLLIGYSRPDEKGEWKVQVNPPLTTPLAPGDAILVLGQQENLIRHQRWLGVKQGR